MAKERLYIELIAEAKGAIAEMKRYTEQAKKSADRVGKLTKLIKSYFGEITAGIMIARKFIKVAQDMVKAYADQEVAEVKLNAALKATGRYAPETEAALHAYAEEMRKLTGIEDDAIIAAAGVMTTFTQISTKTFPEALEAAANMSAMFGQDLQQSVIQLGTALNDPIAGVGRLKRIGISFSEDQRESIKLFMEQNDIMSAQRVILDELGLEIGGVAIALGETYAGKVKILKSEFGELKEAMGGLLAHNIEPMLPKITEITGLIAEWATKKLELKQAYRALEEPMETHSLATSLEIEQYKLLIMLDQLREVQKSKSIIYYDEFGQQIEEATGLTEEYLEKMYQEISAQGQIIGMLTRAISERKAHKDAADEEAEALKKVNDEYDGQITMATDLIIKLQRLQEIRRANYAAIDEEVESNTALIIQLQHLQILREAQYTSIENVTKAIYTQSWAVDTITKRWEGYRKTLKETKKEVDELTDSEREARDSMIAWANGIREGGNVLVDFAKTAIKIALQKMGQYLLTQAAILAAAFQFGAAVAAFIAGTAAIAYSNTLQQGGEVKALQVGGSGFGDKQPAMLEKGEMVLTKETVQQNAAAVGAMRSGEGGGSIGGDVYLDGNKVGKWIENKMRNKNILVPHGAVV